jgi:hypothetical protein
VGERCLYYRYRGEIEFNGRFEWELDSNSDYHSCELIHVTHSVVLVALPRLDFLEFIVN